MILVNPSYRKSLIFGNLYWLRCTGLLLQWVIAQILGVYPQSIGKTSRDEPEGRDAATGARRQENETQCKDSWSEKKIKRHFFSSFILELLENKLLLEEPFLGCYVTEVTWFRHRTPCEEPGGVGGCSGAGAVSSFDPGALLLPSTKHWEPLWFDLSL